MPHIIVLFLCQILYWCIIIIGISSASIVGLQLSSNPAWATLPLGLLAVGSIVTTFPLSLVMQRYGRRVGFMLGAVASLLGGSLCAWAIYRGNFGLFCSGNFLLGIAQASALYYRFAATDSVSPEKRGKAIAWVMSGGIVAALVAPTLALWAKDALVLYVFAGSYILTAALSAMTFLLCLWIPSQPLISNSTDNNGRSLLTIIKQPLFITAISNSMVSHGVMVLIMVSTPLAMLACYHKVSDATYVIQWHVLGMFLPSFFSGKLVDRFGAHRMTLLGILILLSCIAVSLADVALVNFYVGSFLLGIGWNFMYTAGSTMLTNSHLPEERGQVQGFAELIASLLAAVATFGSGVLLHHFSWQVVNLGSLPLLLVAALITLYYKPVILH